MEIIKELSRALNFSYYLHEAAALKEDYFLSSSTSTNESVRLSTFFFDTPSAISCLQDELIGSMTFRIPYRVVEMVPLSLQPAMVKEWSGWPREKVGQLIS